MLQTKLRGYVRSVYIALWQENQRIQWSRREMTIIQMSRTKHCTSKPKYGYETLLCRKSSHSSFCQAFCRCHSYVKIGEKWHFSRVVISPVGRHGGAHAWLQTWRPSCRSSLLYKVHWWHIVIFRLVGEREARLEGKGWLVKLSRFFFRFAPKLARPAAWLFPCSHNKF